MTAGLAARRTARGSACTSCRSRRGTPRCGRPCPSRGIVRIAVDAASAMPAQPSVPASASAISSSPVVGSILCASIGGSTGSCLLRRLLHDLDAHELRGHRLAQMLAHRLEQVEGLGLVLVERIALAVAAQPDHLAQMLEHDQMLAPEMVERLQQDRLLDVAHDVRAPLRDLGRHVLVGAALDAREQLLVGDALFLGPFVDRQVEARARASALPSGRRRPTARDRRSRERAWRRGRRSRRGACR